jgi:uncharacterized protein (TIGR02300 family)
MIKASWGTKRRCVDCAAPFYDLGKQPIHCPKCGAEFRPEVPPKSRRAKPEEKPVPKPVVRAPVAVEEVVELVEEKVGDEGEIIEDPAELGEDEDDMAEVVDEPEAPE